MNHPLVGVWRRISHSPDADLYPERIVFQSNGLYFGHKDAPGSYMIWDVGKFEPSGEGGVRLSTSNDEMITYGFVITGNRVEFTGPGLPELTFCREPG